MRRARAYLRALADGPHAVQLRRFVVVGTVAAAVQTGLLAALVEWGGLQYLLAAAVSIETTIILQYVVNNAWTFEASRNTGRRAFAVGLAKTNLVRGSAIPIQLAVLWLFVDVAGLFYIVANALAIGISGIYRYVLDALWTWG